MIEYVFAIEGKPRVKFPNSLVSYVGKYCDDKQKLNKLNKLKHELNSLQSIVNFSQSLVNHSTEINYIDLPDARVINLTKHQIQQLEFKLI